MGMIKTLIWVVITALVVVFVMMNPTYANVNFWPSEAGYYHFEWPVGIIAIFFYLIGLLPTWLLAKAGKWRLNRKINALESSVKAATTPAAPPLATSSQLAAESPVLTPESPNT